MLSLTSSRKINKLVLGTAQFGLNYGINNYQGKPSLKEVFSTLDYAYDSGVKILDSAEAYGDSHNRIGQYHISSKKKFRVITKFSPKRLDLPINFEERIKKNLEDLNIDNLYAYMFHSYGDLKKNYNKFLNDINSSTLDKINKLGVSVYTNSQLEDSMNYDFIKLIQLPFNMLDNETKRKKLLEKAKKQKIEVHSRSTYLQGLFFKNFNDIPKKLVPLKKYLSFIESINSEKIKINELALNYVLFKTYIDKVIIGVDSKTNLKENLECISLNKDYEIFGKIDEINVLEMNLLNPSNW
jgi:aryl-alcohol dehydrogenase-like predicted oxidoreductase